MALVPAAAQAHGAQALALVPVLAPVRVLASATVLEREPELAPVMAVPATAPD